MAEQQQPEMFHFSESVREYFGKPEVRSAVDLLVENKFVFAPSADDEWRKVDTFYDALLAARQTQIELAKDLARLWHEVWGQNFDELKPIASDPADETLSLSPEIRWNEEYFERHFSFAHSRKACLWVVLGDGPKELSTFDIAFDVRAGKRSVAKRHQNALPPQLSEWRFKHDAIRVSIQANDAGVFNLKEARQLAKNAVKVIGTFTW
ncbi:hypothetical protein [Novosphingobium taihuense]|uniref:Uncharacterized protein n=1 Tax=Novosphingobium taihuense TaxID=260085 RepID=A0A7W7EVS0_9SPHN|nr:hypothetical protein [Novosphingobium taihuense]MBB4615767.1 hypothetical protein [Novosphingobium taihuense]TWH79721.1 hypothetical protein IQ25_03932 [Novosphingobium taihuense]